MQIIDLEQGSPEWHDFRRGRITGTRLGSIWSSRQYTVDDVVNLLTARGVNLAEFQKEVNEQRKAIGKKAGKYTKADLEALLTDEDKEVLSSDAEKKLEYYQVLADQVAVPRPEDEKVMQRGLDLEDDAAQAFSKLTGKKLMVVGCCQSDADPRIIMSPDRLVESTNKDGKITEAVEVKCLNSAKHLMSFFERKIPEEYWTQKMQYFTVNPDLQRLYWVFYDPSVTMLPLFVLVIEREDLRHWPETMLKYQLRTLKELDALTARLFDESDNLILPARAEKV